MRVAWKEAEALSADRIHWKSLVAQCSCLCTGWIKSSDCPGKLLHMKRPKLCRMGLQLNAPSTYANVAADGFNSLQTFVLRCVGVCVNLAELLVELFSVKKNLRNSHCLFL